MLFFVASDLSNGRELWKSDGSADGTTLVKDISPGLANSCPRFLEPVNGVLFFNANGQLWKSDGTESGTILVKNFNYYELS